MSVTAKDVRSNNLTVAGCVVKINGTALSTDIMSRLISAEVEQNILLPSMFSLVFDNKAMQGSGITVKVSDPVEVSMGQKTTQPLLKGEVTAIELDQLGNGTTVFIIRGYDKLHRLQRGQKTRTFKDVTLSDLVSKLAGEAGLSADAESTTPTYKYVMQNNETNYEFLQRRAFRLGMELFADDTKLKLRKPPKDEGVELIWSQNLTRVYARKSGYDPVDGAIVRGWDVLKKEAIVGTHDGEKGKFNASKNSAVYWTVTNQGEAEKVAKSIVEDAAGHSDYLEAFCLGDGELKPGKKVTIKKVDENFSGKYYISAARHIYNRGSYTTELYCTGRHPATMVSLTDQADAVNQNPVVPGFVVGIVTNNKDDEGKMDRVKVKFPTLPQDNGKDIESDWARLALPMAGNDRGFFCLPEVNDEVLVGFVNGDINQPYVVGALWNGKDKPHTLHTQEDAVAGDGKVNIRRFKTRVGHTLTFNDSPDKPRIEIIDKTTKNKIVIDSKENLITVYSEKDILIEAKETITMKAKNVKINTTESIASSAQKDFTVDAKSNVTMKATAKVDIKGTGGADFAGATVNVKGDGKTTVSAGGMTEIKGATVKIN